MTNLRKKKALASRVFHVGLARIWFDPEYLEDLEAVDTREDIRALEARDIIRVLPERGQKRSMSGRKGLGRRKGKKTAKISKKDRWIQRVRSQRRLLKEARKTEEITPAQYRRLYSLVGGGRFRSKAHLREFMEKTLRYQSA